MFFPARVIKVDIVGTKVKVKVTSCISTCAEVEVAIPSKQKSM